MKVPTTGSPTRALDPISAPAGLVRSTYLPFQRLVLFSFFERRFPAAPSVFARLGTRLRPDGLGATFPASVGVQLDEGAR